MGEIQSAIYSQPEMVPSVTMAAAALNASGGVNGHPLKVESCNTNADNNTAIACARKAVSDKVAAVVDMATFEGAAVLPILQAAKIPAIASQAFTPADYSSPAAFPLIDAASGFGATGQQLAGVAGVKKIAVMAIDSQAGLAAAQATVNLAKAKGASARLVPVPQTATDVSSQVQDAIHGSDAIALAVPGQVAALIIPAIRQQDSKMIIGTSSGVYSQAGLSAAQLEGIYVDSPNPPLDDTNDSSISKFLADAQKYGNGNKAIETSNGLLGWTSVQLFAKVASGISGSINSAAVFTAMNGVKNLDFLWLKNYTVDPSSKNRVFNKYIYLCRATGGKLVVEPGNPILVG
ncbi:ABC transporter substrate-binding protein [Jatrophihabitans sp.]|uniref:ABC transporter substrate-binding protein n=1 Tax=Jatrophihabitans sp. TaxID=1932789 RepID=UPI0030C71867